MKETYPRVVELLRQHIPAKISRNEFCRLTGINRNSVDRYLAGLGCPTDETLVKLSDYFDVSIPWLRGEDDDSGALPTQAKNAKQRRKYLNDYRAAAREMELAEMCIGILERMSCKTAQRCVKEMKAVQQEALTQMDIAAEGLGAPYPTR